MAFSSHRRSLLRAAAAAPFALTLAARAAKGAATPETALAALESTSGGRLGVSALDTASGAQIRYRADERFPFCSTFKVILVGAILTRSAKTAGFMQQPVRADDPGSNRADGLR